MCATGYFARALGRVLRELDRERRMDRIGLGDDEQAGRLAVDPVHDPRPDDAGRRAAADRIGNEQHVGYMPQYVGRQSRVVHCATSGDHTRPFALLCNG